MSLGLEVGNDSALWACVDWLNYLLALGSEWVAQVGFYFTGWKGISRVTFSKVARWLSSASFFYSSNAAVDTWKASSALWGWQDRETQTLKVVTSGLHRCAQRGEGTNSICFLYFKTVSVPNISSNLTFRASVQRRHDLVLRCYVYVWGCTQYLQCVQACVAVGM